MTYPNNHDGPVPDGAAPDGQAPEWAETMEQAVLDAALRRLPDHQRWDDRLVAAAGAAAGLSGPEIELLLPYGPKDLAALLARRHDTLAMQRLAEVDAGSLKIRERITLAVATRLQVAMADDLAVRRSAGFLALPSHAPLAGRLMWDTADQLWRWAGDTATDFNHYSKRTILSTVLASTLAVWLARGEDAANTHLAARIEGVMAFEKMKAGLKLDPEGVARSVTGVLARLRYGPRPAGITPETDPSAG